MKLGFIRCGAKRKQMEQRQKAIEWFNSMNLEEQFYKTIEANHLLVGDTVDRHPNNLTGREIEIIYNYNFDDSSIVRSNMLEDKNYTPYCMDCSGLVRMKFVSFGKQLVCPKCNKETKFSNAFLGRYSTKHKTK